MVQQHRDAKTKQDKERGQHQRQRSAGHGAKKVVNTDAVSIGKSGKSGSGSRPPNIGGGGHQVPHDPLSLENLDKIVTGYDKSVTGDDVVTATLFIDAVIAGDVGAVLGASENRSFAGQMISEDVINKQVRERESERERESRGIPFKKGIHA